MRDLPSEKKVVDLNYSQVSRILRGILLSFLSVLGFVNVLETLFESLISEKKITVIFVLMLRPCYVCNVSRYTLAKEVNQ